MSSAKTPKKLKNGTDQKKLKEKLKDADRCKSTPRPSKGQKRKSEDPFASAKGEFFQLHPPLTSSPFTGNAKLHWNSP